MGCFMIIYLKHSVDYVMNKMASIDNRLQPFCDADKTPSDFEVSLKDCLQALDLAIERKWYRYN